MFDLRCWTVTFPFSKAKSVYSCKFKVAQQISLEYVSGILQKIVLLFLGLYEDFYLARVIGSCLSVRRT